MFKKVLMIVGIAILCGLSVWLLLFNKKSYDIKITIPAGTSGEFIYSDEEISPTGNKIKIYSSYGLGDIAVILKPIEVKEENVYESTYFTQGMPIEMEIEKGAWFKIGVIVENITDKDIEVYVTVKGVELRIE